MIASTYEILRQIGSGGGGNVFLAYHKRLGKKVVLKVDKRKLAAGPALLRREVDILKELNHPRIPRVYDFFVEGENVYTVMDFIEGESLDKPLKRGERFPQPLVIRWGIQLLEALNYLHAPTHGDPPRGFVHSDIKPANLMRTPSNDIVLIDFNITLALGEENAVGRSAGYASPEHYGLDFSTEGGTERLEYPAEEEQERKTERLDSAELERGAHAAAPDEGQGISTGSSSASHFRKILPDVRSDIYSTGATLYHLLSDVRPKRNAKEVVPLSEAEFSASLVKIIQKAMEPNPDLRYQTAAEMLWELSHLRETDPRAKRLRRGRAVAGSLLFLMFAAGACSAFVGLKRMQTRENWLKLAEYSKNALAEGDPDRAAAYALEALPTEKNLLTPAYTPEAQRALAAALGVYDLSDGYRNLASVKLPSAPLFMELSPDGATGVFVYAYEAALADLETGEILETLPAETSALSEVRYLDADRFLYAGQDGLSLYSISQRKILWTAGRATAICVSADGSYAAAVYKDDPQAAIYRTEDGSLVQTVDFGGKRQRVTVNDGFANPQDNLLALNKDGSMLAASFEDGALTVFDLDDPQGDLLIFDETSGYTHFEGGFYDKYFAFSAAGEGQTPLFAVIDAEEGVQTGGFDRTSPFGVQADESGIYMQTDNILVKIDPETGEQEPLVTTLDRILHFARGGADTMIATKENYEFYDTYATLISSFPKQAGGELIRTAEGRAAAGSRDEPDVQLFAYEAHPEGEIFSYDSSYPHDEARLSADGRTVMLFSYQQFRVYGIGGELISETDIPDAEQVYDQQYVREDGVSRLEVIYNNGHVRLYSGADGSLIGEETREAPDLSLQEEFLTDNYRIESPLHGTPAAYDRETGKWKANLDEDAYLTYITQAGDYIVAQYVTAEGERYGQLLDADCQVIADLPYLSDVRDGELIFDYPTGKLRKTRIYDINELIELARNKEEGGK